MSRDFTEMVEEHTKNKANQSKESKEAMMFSETEDGCGTRIYRCGQTAAEYVDDYYAGYHRPAASFLSRRGRIPC